MRRIRALAMVVLVVVGLVGVSCTAKPKTGTGGTGPTGVGSWSVNPSATDPAISGDPVFTHLAYAPTTTARNKLVVVFHGSESNPQAHLELANALRSDGYHVILLRYRTNLYTFGACPDDVVDSFPDCHRQFRSETVFGGGVADPAGQVNDHPADDISKANSVMNRLLKLVEYLATVAPASGWGSFQQRSAGTCEAFNATYGACDLVWPDVVTMGHSQGSGVALYLGKFFPLSKVALLSGSYDAFERTDGSYVVAPWITEGGMAVANSDIGTFIHTSDYGQDRFRAVADAALMTGPEVSVQSASPPYGGSRRLITSLEHTCPFDGAPNHDSTGVDVCVPNGAYDAVWRYLAGS